MAWWMKRLCVAFALGTVAAALAYGRLGWGAALSLAITCGTCFYHGAMRLLVGLAVDRLCAGRTFSCQHGWFAPKGFEPALYRRLRVKRWKRHMPTYAPEQFSLRLHTPQEVLHAMCVAELVHEGIAVLSFLPLALIGPFGSAGVFLVTSVLACCVDLAFAIMQRYNRPRLARLVALAAARDRAKPEPARIQE